MNPQDRETIARRVVATYNPPNWEQPWDAVESYRAFQEWYATNPDASSTAAARALEQPRGRIREWMNGSRPDPVRALEIAEYEGWLDIEWDQPQSQALNCLVAWTFSGGSIAQDTYVPLWTYGGEPARRLLSEFIQTVCEGDAVDTERSSGRSNELTLEENRSVFGRLLSVLGCPVGEKNNSEGPYQLPTYLDGAPTHIQLDFARVYFLNRAVPRRSERFPFQIREERPPAYLGHLQVLLGQFVDEIAVSSDDQMVYLSRDATDSLDSKPHAPSDYAF